MAKNRMISRTGFVIFFGVLAPYFSVSAKQIATVNGKAITEADLNSTLSAVNEGQKEAILNDPTLRHQALLDVVHQELLVQESQKLKLDQDPEYKSQLDTLRKQLLIGRLLRQKVKVSDSEAKGFYESHKDRYSTTRVHVQHILVGSEDEAHKVLKMAKEGNKDFQELAEQYSKDPHAKNNRGDIGFIGQEQFDRSFTDVAFSTSKGQIAGPVHTLFGYHLIKVIDRREGKPLEFDEVALKVKGDMQQQMAQIYVGELKKQAKVQIERAPGRGIAQEE